jgi:hypothetical protein
MLIICCEVFVFFDSILQNIILEVKKNTLKFRNLCTLYNVCSLFMCQCLLIIKSDHIRQIFICCLCSPRLNGYCHEMNIFPMVLKTRSVLCCICADDFYNIWLLLWKKLKINFLLASLNHLLILKSFPVTSCRKLVPAFR